MKAASLCIGCVLLVMAPTHVHASDLDKKLALVTKVYDLKPKDCSVDKQIGDKDSKFAAGKALFESKSLSGGRDTSCSTCHLDEFATTDGLPIAVGVGGEGEGPARMAQGDGVLVTRNAFSMRGRGQPEFTAFFWDGKVQEDGGHIVSQLGEYLPKKFTDTLEVAAIVPILERDEFVGIQGRIFPNDIAYRAADKYYHDRYEAISQAIRERLLEEHDPEDAQLAGTLESAGVDVSQLELADLGVLIADFIRHNFQCNESRWDQYLAGDQSRLSKDEKEGALLFYGKGRCASCHAGSFFSDFQYHSIGAPQGQFGPHSRHRDIGRAGVTHRSEDLYQFRTPPLTEVSETPPYGHNGIFPTLRDVVTHHMNPVAFYLSQPEIANTENLRIGKLLEARSPILATIDIESDSEINKILAFLQAL